MPWSPEDAPKHDKEANTSARKRLWARVANKTLLRTGDDARAIREANSVVKKKARHD